MKKSIELLRAFLVPMTVVYAAKGVEVIHGAPKWGASVVAVALVVVLVASVAADVADRAR